MRLLSSSTLCVPSLFLSETSEFPDGDLLRFDDVCLAVLQPLLFSYIRYVFLVPCSFLFCALVFVGLLLVCLGESLATVLNVGVC